jgi:hypothetical protein
MPKLNYPMILAAVIAGVVVLLIQEFAFKREIVTPAAGGANQIQTKLFFQD